MYLSVRMTVCALFVQLLMLSGTAAAVTDAAFTTAAGSRRSWRGEWRHFVLPTCWLSDNNPLASGSHSSIIRCTPVCEQQEQSLLESVRALCLSGVCVKTARIAYVLARCIRLEVYNSATTFAGDEDTSSEWSSAKLNTLLIFFMLTGERRELQFISFEHNLFCAVFFSRFEVFFSRCHQDVRLTFSSDSAFFKCSRKPFVSSAIWRSSYCFSCPFFASPRFQCLMKVTANPLWCVWRAYERHVMRFRMWETCSRLICHAFGLCSSFALRFLRALWLITANSMPFLSVW